MNPVDQSRPIKTCQGCRLWNQSKPGMVPDAQTIQECIRRVLGDKRPCMTGEEFLAQVEAHRRVRLKAEQTPRKPFKPGPFVREYRLRGGNWEFKAKTKASIAPKPEVMP